MKRIIYILFAISILWGCEQEEVSFPAGISLQDLSFTPTSGGAVMHYKLPSDDEVISIKLRYLDFRGDEVTIEGSYACDSLVIIGFNKAQKGVPARVTLCNRQEQESSPIDVTFDTYDSGATAFFNTVEIEPYWNGFLLRYTGIRRSNGFANIFYKGIDPISQKPSLLFIDRIIIQEGEHSLKYSLQQAQDKYTIVIRTEDFRGYMVEERTYEDIGINTMFKLDPASYTFTCKSSVEDPSQKLGKSYLFDGDVKGYDGLGRDADDTNFFTFLAGPDAVGIPFIVHFNEPQIPASVRLYTMLNVRFFGKGIFNFCYYNRLPCSVSLYGTNTPEDKDSWVLLGKKEEPREAPFANRWCSRAPGCAKGNMYEKEEVDGAEPQYLNIQLPTSNVKYTDMIIVVDDVFSASVGYVPENDNKYVTFNELEVYVKQ